MDFELKGKSDVKLTVTEETIIQPSNYITCKGQQL